MEIPKPIESAVKITFDLEEIDWLLKAGVKYIEHTVCTETAEEWAKVGNTTGATVLAVLATARKRLTGSTTDFTSDGLLGATLAKLKKEAGIQ